MTTEEIKVLERFAKYMDDQRNSVTKNMWNEKVVWSKEDAFQQWLSYYLKTIAPKEYLSYIESLKQNT